jgi:DNA-directed RNA polymerase subunit omega
VARVTVEDCIRVVPSQYDLVLLASRRAYKIQQGSQPFVERKKHAATTLALIEIAEKAINAEKLEDELIRSMQRYRDEDDFIDGDASETFQIDDIEAALACAARSKRKVKNSDAAFQFAE